VSYKDIVHGRGVTILGNLGFVFCLFFLFGLFLILVDDYVPFLAETETV
jgi:hypothetical protein